MIVDRRLLPHLDWPLVAALAALTLIGLATIYSVTWNQVADEPGAAFWTQLYVLPVAFAALIVCLTFDYRTLAERSLLIYAVLVVALIYVAFFGAVRGGARRWMTIGGLTLQPSEFARITLALALGLFFADNRRTARSTGRGRVQCRYRRAAVLSHSQAAGSRNGGHLDPRVSSASCISPGLRLRWIGMAALVFVLLSPVIWQFGLEDYQKERFEMFIDPSKDPRGAGYQQIQAKITVGSGGLYGKGPLGSTQGSYGFLPVAHNDFVFSVFAEEYGFLGVLVALALYLFVIVRSLDAARLARDRVGAMLVVAIISGFGFQVLYNITMSAGLAPVKGLTLPLMSYGGSSLVATLAGFGLILNVRMRRFTN